MMMKMSRKERQDNDGQKKRVVAWTFCTKCHAVYPSTQLVCAFCYNMAKEKPKGNLLTSEFARTLEIRCGEEYPLGIRRMNIDYPMDGKPSCVTCMQEEKCYCEKFGNPERQCSREDFEYCPCRRCCAETKKFIRSLKAKE